LHYEGERAVSIWQDILTAPPDHMRIAGQQRRNAILQRCVQLKLDFDSYRDNNRYQAELPELSFNFEQDIEELGFPETYRDPDDPDGEGE